MITKVQNLQGNKYWSLATLTYCIIVQITISILDRDYDYVSKEQYILGITLIGFSEILLTVSLSFNYKLIRSIFWTIFSLKSIGIAFIFNKNPHQILLFLSCILSQFVYVNQFSNITEASEIQHTYNQVNNIIQQFLDSQSKWSKQMKIRLQFIQTIQVHKSLTIKEQFQIEKILTYNVNSEMWASKFNKYILQLTKIYKDQFQRYQIVNQKLKNNFQILVSRLNSYVRKLEDEHHLYTQIQTLGFKDKNQFNQDSLQTLDTIRNLQSKIIDWLTNEESNLNETINILIKSIEQIREQLNLDDQARLALPLNQFVDYLMSLNFDKQQLIYNLIQQQTDLRQLKHKYIRRLNKIKVNQQQSQQFSKFQMKEMEFNELYCLESHFQQLLTNLVSNSKPEESNKMQREILDEIVNIGKDKQKLEDENISLKGLLMQTESISMFEESQRLLTKNDESFAQSKICSHR